jgi:glycolate oxidase FAD binding subunit
MNEAQAVQQVNRWGGQPLPIGASAWLDGRLWIRLAGARAAVDGAVRTLGGDAIEATGPQAADAPWDALRDHRHPYFVAASKAVEQGASLWRLSVAATSAPLGLEGESLTEWGGAQRWLVGDAPAAVVRESARAAGGHATLFRGRGDGSRAFAPLTAPIARFHERLMATFDPERIFNRGRLH